MMSGAKAFETIAEQLDQAISDLKDGKDVRHLLFSAHTHAVIQCAYTRRAEARAFFAAYPDLEQGPPQ